MTETFDSPLYQSKIQDILLKAAEETQGGQNKAATMAVLLPLDLTQGRTATAVIKYASHMRCVFNYVIYFY